MKNRKFVILTISILIILGITISIQLPKIQIANAYAAKKVCSCLFVAQRNPNSIIDQDLNIFPLQYADIEIDTVRKNVSASILGLKKATAQYKDGLGCSLIIGDDNYNIRFITERPHTQYLNDSLAWPYGKQEVTHSLNQINSDLLNDAFELAFDKEGEWMKQTRALLVIQNDTLLHEQYAEGFDLNTPILGWSMTKSITNALIGILIKNGTIELDQDHLFQQWSNDQRREITVDNLLRMSSGLMWNENYGSISDVTKTLYTQENSFDFIVEQDQETEPGIFWEYSSGTTNLLGQLIRNQFEQFIQYQAFPYLELFNKIGMDSAQLECDEAGNYVLSSYCYASPRDWAKLGQLYLNNGRWKHLEILDESFIDYSILPAPACKDENYGAHIWLNTNGNSYPDVEEEMFIFNGFQGQHVCIIPSKKLVVVRMGLSTGPPFDMNQVLSLISRSVTG